MQLTTRVLVIAWILIAAAGLGGCAYALGPRQLVKGHAFAKENLEALTVGMTEDQVLALLGEPFKRQPRGRTEFWLYYQVHQLRACRVELFGLVPITGRPHQTDEVLLRFEQGKLLEVRSSERAGRQKPSLLQSP